MIRTAHPGIAASLATYLNMVRERDDSRDLRDPLKLGQALVALRDQHNTGSLRAAYEQHDTSRVERYNANFTTLEKYGRPQDLPVTPF